MARADKQAAQQAALAKAAATGSKAAATAPKKQRWYKQVIDTYKYTRVSDPKLPWVLGGIFAAGIAITVLLSVLTPWWWFFVPIGILTSLTVVLFVFGRRAEKAAYAQVEGQVGAAAAVLQQLKSGWFSTPAVAFNKSQDIIHRVVGKPGVILVAEGPRSRTESLMSNEVKRIKRFVGETPIHEVYVGEGSGDVTLRKLNRTIMKLPSVLRPAEVTDLRKRLDAVAATSGPMPIPKGPMPKSAKAAKGMSR